MIQIYAPGNTNFDRNGDVALQPSLCDLDMTLNGEWELEIEAPADELGKFRAVTTGAVVAVPTPWSDKQLFRIYDHDTSDDGSVGLARPIFLDALNEVMILDKRPTSCNGQAALDAILSGTKYSGKSNIAKISTAYYIRKNAIQAIASDEENSFLNRWGGEIAYDNFTVTVNERMGLDRGLRVEFGRNIKSIHDHGNSEELATRIYPVAYNGRMISGDKKYVDSERIGDYPIVYSKILECQDIKLREDLNGEPSDGDIVCDTQAALDAALRQRCAEQYAAGADVLETAFDVDMDDLSTKEEYEEYKSLEKVELGDTVHCHHRRLNISAIARVVRMVWDCIRRKNKKLYIGDYKKDYFARLNDTAQRLQDLRDEMVESESRLNQAVKDASERLSKLISESSGLYPTAQPQPDGSIVWLLHDKRELAESTIVIKIGSAGIGLSTDGGNSYPYGYTVTGKMVMDYIAANGIDCSWLNAGVINLAVLSLAGTLCGLMQGYGSTGDGQTTQGIVMFGNGKDSAGRAKPPYLIVTSAGIRHQISDTQYVYYAGGFASFQGLSITATGNISAGGTLAAGGKQAAAYTSSTDLMQFATNAMRSWLSGRQVYMGEDGSTSETWLRGNSIQATRTIQTSSDERVKKDITPLPSAYITLLDNMQPVLYRYDREADDAPPHIGYTTGDVKRALRRAGLKRADLAALGDYRTEDGQMRLSLAYEEIIPILHSKIMSMAAEIQRIKEDMQI